MPTYEYQCPEGHEFELFQKMSEKPRAKCPVCGKMASRKISGGAGLVFKGSGFYITDYGKDGKGPRKADKADAADKPAPSTSEGADRADRRTGGPADGADKSDQPAAKADKPDSAPTKTPKPHKKKAAE
jgi:putative FmdB family regulatory protein